MILWGDMAKNRISRVIGGIQRMKKIVASILTAIMLMVVFQTAAFAVEGEGAEASVSPNPGGEMSFTSTSSMARMIMTD